MMAVTEQYQQYPTEPHPAGRILGRSLSERPTPNLDRCQAIRDEEVPPDWLIDRMWSCDIKTETSADTPEETNKRHRNVRAFTITLRINLRIAPINVFFSNQWVNSYALISVICFVGSPPVPGTQKRIWIIWLICFCVCDVGPDGFHIFFFLLGRCWFVRGFWYFSFAIWVVFCLRVLYIIIYLLLKLIKKTTS